MADETGDGTTKPVQTNVPYAKVSTQAWANKVRETFDYRAGVGIWVLFGICPRCEHPMSQPIEPHVAFDQLKRVGDWRPDPLLLDELTVHCLCTETHAPGQTGCGAFGELYQVRFE